MVGKLSNWITTGKSIDRIFPLAGAAEGYKYMESGQSKGKVLFQLQSQNEEIGTTEML
jgi:hypothetical protein